MADGVGTERYRVGHNQTLHLWMTFRGAGRRSQSAINSSWATSVICDIWTNSPAVRPEKIAISSNGALSSAGLKLTSCHMIAVRSERAVRRVWDWPSPSVYWPTPTTGSFGNYNNNNTASTLILMVPVDFERGRRKKKKTLLEENVQYLMGDVRGWIMGDWLKRLPKMMDLLSRGHNGHWWASCTHRAGRSEAQLIPLPAIGCGSLACSKQLSAFSFQVVRRFFFFSISYITVGEQREFAPAEVLKLVSTLETKLQQQQQLCTKESCHLEF